VLLAAAAEAHDHTTGRHLHRVQTITEMIARELGYSEERAQALGLAATLHDIGKIRVPESILLSPSRLNGEEWALMKQHTVWGAEFLSERPGFELAATIARAHHERYDGTGYPSGLTGDHIPEAAAIVSVADALDAITNDRPYRAGQPVDWAVAEIQRCSGTQLHPRVVDALVRLYQRDRALFAGFGPALPDTRAA
jgi:putative nucleotidyltransferase with HDIG domain